MAEPNANPKRHFHFTIFMFATFLCFFRGKSSQFGLYNSGLQLNEDDNEANMAHTRPQNSRSCDYTAGKWVYDPSYPLYDTTCPYLSRGVNCQKNGRPDSEYQKWKWKPHSCSIPRYFCFKSLYLFCGSDHLLNLCSKLSFLEAKCWELLLHFVLILIMASNLVINVEFRSET